MPPQNGTAMPELSGAQHRILAQLNRGEGRHALSREVCHGRRGELRQLYAKAKKNSSARSA